MKNNFGKFPLWEVSPKLSLTALGKEKADTVILNTKLINVCTREILEGIDIAIKCGRIALVGDAKHCIGDETKVIDAFGQYAAPGFLDGHIHIESSMLSVGEYAKAVVPHGTTIVYIDPHEICNVTGLTGVKAMMEDSKRVPLKVLVTTPSCVPAVPGFEDTGAFIGSEDVAETMKWDNVVGLGEMMNFPGILGGSPHAHGEVGETLKTGGVVTGHYSLPETKEGLNSYVAAGIRCCHESTRAEDALAKIRLGMYAQVREGSAWHDLKHVIKAVTENNLDTRYVCLISDDTHPHTLIADGHLDHIVKRAIEEGVEPIEAIQMVTINAAQCFRMDHEVGSIAPGKCADIVLIDDLENVHVTKVMIDGDVVAEDGKYLNELAPYKYPESVLNSVHIKGEITPDSFKIPAPKGTNEVRVIEIIPGRVSNYERHITMDAKNGYLESDVERDILKTAVFERHHETGNVGFGFSKGFGIKCGAMASTVSHDAHNLLVIGTNDEDMAIAANHLISTQGGMCTVQNGEILASMPLPIAGLMCDKSAEEASNTVAQLEESWKVMGCDAVSPFMTMSLIALACLPELRLTDKGLVDCNEFKFVPLTLD